MKHRWEFYIDAGIASVITMALVRMLGFKNIPSNTYIIILHPVMNVECENCIGKLNN